VPLVEQELLTPSEAPEFTPSFSGVHVTRSLVLCFVDRFVLLGIVLSVLQFLDSDYPFVIFKLFSGTHLFNLVANPVISHENSVVFTMILVKKNAELAINNNHSLIPNCLPLLKHLSSLPVLVGFMLLDH
jgi:hypothetical protein